ncbi:MAG: hypothetical protein LUH36_05070 [Oscillospiraceae bacterium]|nr:hypothetical protein [Oscillospiraceae bacterium]
MKKTNRERTALAPAVRRSSATVSIRRLLLAMLLSAAGFLIAILSNVLIPQIAEISEPARYTVGHFSLDRNGFYRLVLLGILLIYVVAGVLAWHRETRRPRYVK